MKLGLKSTTLVVLHHFINAAINASPGHVLGHGSVSLSCESVVERGLRFRQWTFECEARRVVFLTYLHIQVLDLRSADAGAFEFANIVQYRITVCVPLARSRVQRWHSMPRRYR